MRYSKTNYNEQNLYVTIITHNIVQVPTTECFKCHTVKNK